MQTITTRIPNRHGLNIAVLVEIPENSKGLAFTVHGWNSLKETPSISAIAKTGLANCITIVRFDCTHSCGESDGAIENSSITTYSEDLADVIAWAKTQTWFQTPYILYGSSLGGLAVLEQGYKNKKEVLGLGLLAPAISGDLYLEALEKRLPGTLQSWRETGFWEVDTDSKGKVKIPLSNLEDRLRYNAMAYAEELRMPVLISVGENDNTCPVYQQQLLLEALGSKQKELHILKGIGHGIRTEEALTSISQHFSSWLAKIV